MPAPTFASTLTGGHYRLAGGRTNNTDFSFFFNATEVWRYNATSLSILSTIVFQVGSGDRTTISDGDGATNLIPALQLHGIGTAFAGGANLIATYNTTNTQAVSPKLAFVKGAAATQVATTALADNEVAGSIIAYGSDAIDFGSPLASIEFVVNGTVGAGDMPGSIEFSTTTDGGEALALVLTMNADGNTFVANGNGFVIGHTAQVDTDGLSEFQVLGTTAADSSIILGLWSTTDGLPPTFKFIKSGNAAIDGNTTVADNELLGDINWHANDGGDDVTQSARIRVEVDDAAVAASSIGGAFVFFLATGVTTDSITETFRIAALGLITHTAGTAPASVAGATGTAHPGAITSTGGVGGATSITSTGTGGIGAGYIFTAGAGGTAASAATAGTGGAGGAYAVTAGAGAASIITSSNGGTGGAGGAISFTTGVGGATTTSTGTNTGGASGALSLTTGTGGASQDGTDTGGISGAITITTGTGGASDTGGASGDITLQTGAAGSGGGPATGNIIFNTGGATLRLTLDDTVLTLGTGMDIQMSTTGFIIYSITDVDSAVEAAMWYSAADNKLEFFNGSVKEAITSSGFLWQAYENPTIYRQMYSPYFNDGINPDVFVKEGTWVEKPLIPGLGVEQFEWHVGDKSIMVVESFLSDGEVHALPYPLEEALEETRWADSIDKRLQVVEKTRELVTV